MTTTLRWHLPDDISVTMQVSSSLRLPPPQSSDSTGSTGPHWR